MLRFTLSIEIDIFNEAINIFKDVNSVYINMYKKEWKQWNLDLVGIIEYILQLIFMEDIHLVTIVDNFKYQIYLLTITLFVAKFLMITSWIYLTATVLFIKTRKNWEKISKSVWNLINRL